MALKVFNTLSRKKELLKPLKDNEIGIYSCGPTVYNFAHIGNLRAYIFVDLLKRYIKFRGFKVKHVMNITDVDDKTIRGSREEGIPLGDFTKKYEKEFLKDLQTLNIEPADILPRATEHIKEMVNIIKELEKKGIAYKGDDGSVYFNIRKFRGYGKLSHLKINELKAGARVKQDKYEKENASDFALWKAWTEEDKDVFWETDIGKGRPGWHIECSAMSTKYLGQPFDIHTGGVDLIFPHHENEIAQSEGAFGKPFVKYWCHNEHLLVDNKKMSKSEHNFFTLRDLLEKGYDPIAIRYELLTTHYRQKMNFTFKSLDSSKNAVQRLKDFMLNMKHAAGSKDNPEMDNHIENAKEDFIKAMDNDLDIAAALRAVFQFIRRINKLNPSKKDAFKVFRFMKEIDSVLGVMESGNGELPEELMSLIKEREKARKEKDFEKSDKIRDEFKEKGILLDDRQDGTVWKKA